MKKIDIAVAPSRIGSGYPPPFGAPCATRVRTRLGLAGGLTEFGVNLLRLPPGVWSSQRHWHSHEDEFVWVVEGEVVLITEYGEETLKPGDCAAFKAGDSDGHHLVNRTDRDAVVLEVGNSDEARDRTTYSDIDMIAEPRSGYVRKNGSAI